MTDALCGPVNPLTNFQKHSQQDRSLQQDRLRSQPSTSHGFRSSPLNAGNLDPEFEAFQAGGGRSPIPFATPSPISLLQPTQVPRHHSPLGKAPVYTATPDWALDFQRLNVSSPAPITQQNAAQAPMAFSSATMSHSLRASAGPAFANTLYQPSYQEHMIGGGYGAGMGLRYIPGHEQQSAQMGDGQAFQMPVFDDAAFAAAFDSAAAIMQAEMPVESKEKHVTFNEVEALMRSDEELDAVMQEVFTRTGQHEDDLSTLSVNRDILQGPPTHDQHLAAQENKAEQQPLGVNDGDALAQTAKQLLDSVSHETSEKFAQSSFMALMRRLRDKEVKVDGENFIDSSTNAIANTTGEASSVADLSPALDNPQAPAVDPSSGES